MNNSATITETPAPRADQKTAALTLWNQEYPAQLRLKDAGEFNNYLQPLGAQRHLFCTIEDEIRGWAFAFTRENKRWFAIIVSSSVHQRGIGSLLLEQLRLHENELYGWVVDHNSYIKADGSAYRSPLGFYIRKGFMQSPVRLETDKLSAIQIHWKNVSVF